MRNKLTPTKTVKREVSGVNVQKASGGYIVEINHKWQDLGPNESYEPSPEPKVFGEGQDAEMLAYVKSVLGAK